MRLILYIWKSSWRDRWVRGGMISNPCSVFVGWGGAGISLTPSVVLHGWWLLPHAWLTRVEENKITSVLVWRCVRAGLSLRLRLALCAVRKDGNGATMPPRSRLKEIICTILWKLHLSGWMVLSKPNSCRGSWLKNDGWATKMSG